MGLSLGGAEWVLYLLVLISIYSVSVIVERALFYRSAAKGLGQFRDQIRAEVQKANFGDALKLAQTRNGQVQKGAKKADLETGLAQTILENRLPASALSDLALDQVLRAKQQWERGLSGLATIGSNAPFVGLFGTVLGIIKAFHDLSQAGAGAQTVSSGISEALIATAVGILVAIPAVVAYNLFMKKVKAATQEAEALKSFLLAHVSANLAEVRK